MAASAPSLKTRPSAPPQTAIRISCRVRPSLKHELEARLTASPSNDELECDSDSGKIVCPHKGKSHIYNFSSVHSPEATQLEVFTKDVAPMLDQVYSGVSCTVFSYGVTGSGKTHTMQGIPTSKDDMGIIPRVVKALFLKRARMKKVNIEVYMEYMEIYRDECFDLLVQRAGGHKLDVRTNDKGQNVVAGLTKKLITSPAEFDQLYTDAASHRSTASTKLNSQSSRSHAVLTIEIRTEEVKEGGKVFTGRINLVDLAGSENNKLTGNDKDRMAESAAINKSLTTLGSVIDALNKGHPRVPYRDSKLTRILQDTLGGSSVGLLICNLAPGVNFRQDTINTLNFATRTKEVENRIVVNETSTKPVPKPHFAALTKQVRQVPVYRDASATSASLGQPVRAGAGAAVTTTTTTAVRSRPMLGAVSSNRTIEREPAASAGAKGKGKEILPLKPARSAKATTPVIATLDEQEMGDRIAALVNEAVAKKLSEIERERNAASKDAVAAMPTDLQERVSALEKDVKAQTDKAAATELLDVARKHHDRAAKYSDRDELRTALSYYQRASAFIPTNRNVADRVNEIQAAILYDLPIPSRKKNVVAAATTAASSEPEVKMSRSHRSRKLSNVDDVIEETTAANSSQPREPAGKRTRAEPKSGVAASPRPEKRKRAAATRRPVFIDSSDGDDDDGDLGGYGAEEEEEWRPTAVAVGRSRR